MKKQIPDLYENINFTTLPNSIYTKISQYGHERSFRSFNNKEGKRITEYGEKMPPSFVNIEYDEFNFMMLVQMYELFDKRIKNKEIRNKKGTVLDYKTMIPYWLEYSKGFHKGYSNYGNRMKEKESFFNLTDKNRQSKTTS